MHQVLSMYPNRPPGKNGHEHKFKPNAFPGPRIIDDNCSCHGVVPLFELHPLLDCLGLSDRLLPLGDQGFLNEPGEAE
jgi:hypothetical protein